MHAYVQRRLIDWIRWPEDSAILKDIHLLFGDHPCESGEQQNVYLLRTRLGSIGRLSVGAFTTTDSIKNDPRTTGHKKRI